MKNIFYFIFKNSRILVLWSNEQSLQSVLKKNSIVVSKTFDVIAECFLFIYNRVEGFGLYIGWLKRKPFYVDEAIKNSEERLKHLEKMNASQIFIDLEKKILTKRRWIQHLGFKTMEEWNTINYHKK